MFKATKDLPAESFDRLTEDVGGVNNASTYDDFTDYYEVVPANHLQRLLWAEAERMGALVVDEANFKSERDVVKEELRQRVLADPYGRLFALMSRRRPTPSTPTTAPGIGSIEELDAADPRRRARLPRHLLPARQRRPVRGRQLRRRPSSTPGSTSTSAPLKTPPRRSRGSPPSSRRARARGVTGYGPNVPLPAVAITWLGAEGLGPGRAGAEGAGRHPVGRQVVAALRQPGLRQADRRRDLFQRRPAGPAGHLHGRRHHGRRPDPRRGRGGAAGPGRSACATPRPPPPSWPRPRTSWSPASCASARPSTAAASRWATPCASTATRPGPTPSSPTCRRSPPPTCSGWRRSTSPATGA